MSYMSGVMTCRSSVDGILLGEKLSILSTGDFEKLMNTILTHLIRIPRAS
jgi:hypothetical protein